VGVLKEEGEISAKILLNISVFIKLYNPWYFFFFLRAIQLINSTYIAFYISNLLK